MTARQPLPVRAANTVGECGSGGVWGKPSTAEVEVSHTPTPPHPHTASATDPDIAGLWRALGEVLDPEFPISIVDLGLVYGVRCAGDLVEIDLTFTATGCPCMDFIHEDIRERLLREPAVRAVRIRDVWDPPWTRERISAAGRAALRRHGVAA